MECFTLFVPQVLSDAQRAFLQEALVDHVDTFLRELQDEEFRAWIEAGAHP